MNIKPDKYKSLLAVTKNRKIISIPNKVMRKQIRKKDQDSNFTPNSICIVCNYSYYTNKDRGWSSNVGAICHPFKDDSIFPRNKKLYLFSESDLCDTLWMNDILLLKNRDNYEYDFFYFTIDSRQGIKCKGYHSLLVIAQAAKDLGMKGLVLDYYPKFPRPSGESGSEWDIELNRIRKRLKKFDNIKIKRGWFDQIKINKLMNKCKFVIFPNTRDASPRLIPETLLRGKPIMVNTNILGGWKYSNDINGLLYDGSFSIEQLKDNTQYYYEKIKKALIEISNRKFNPVMIKQNYLEKYGFFNSTKRIAAIINNLEGHKKYRHVAYVEFNKYLKSIL